MNLTSSSSPTTSPWCGTSRTASPSCTSANRRACPALDVIDHRGILHKALVSAIPVPIPTLNARASGSSSRATRPHRSTRRAAARSTRGALCVDSAAPRPRTWLRPSRARGLVHPPFRDQLGPGLAPVLAGPTRFSRASTRLRARAAGCAGSRSSAQGEWEYSVSPDRGLGRNVVLDPRLGRDHGA